MTLSKFLSYFKEPVEGTYQDVLDALERAVQRSKDYHG